MNTYSKKALVTPESTSDSTREYFPIRLLSEKTNVGTSTLRAWERRYGLLTPERAPKGHRLYSHADVQRVFKILDLLNDGHSLPNIAELLSTESQPAGQPASTEQEPALSIIWKNFLDKTLQAVNDFNSERIDAIYNEASSLYPIDMVTEQLIEPALRILGKEWQTHPKSGIAREHFYSSWLKNRLGARFHHAYSQARGARIICACAPGTYHEIGLMLFSLSALSRGYRVLYFGSGLPLDQLEYAAQRSAAKAVILSVQTRMADDFNKELCQLIKKLSVPIFMGGNYSHFNSDIFAATGGILLGHRAAIAINIFQRTVPPFSQATES